MIDNKPIDYLPFIIKTYKAVKPHILGKMFEQIPLSHDLEQSENSSGYKISGPFGRGLELTEKMEGEVVMISAGTGFLPFVNFLDFLLRKAIFMAAKVGGKDELVKSIYPQQDYGSMLSKCRFRFFGAFSSDDDFLIKEILTTLCGISETHDLDLFKACVRLPGGVAKPNANPETPATNHKVNKPYWKTMKSSKLVDQFGNKVADDKTTPLITSPGDRVAYTTTNTRFDDIEFLEKNVPLGARVFICGTPEMNKQIYNNLRALGFSDYDLYLI